MELTIRYSNVYTRNRDASAYIIVNQGGTSSSKTYSILQLLLKRALTEKLHISICSLAMPHLRKGAMKDWLDILGMCGVYAEEEHNKTDSIFKVKNSTVEFFSLDSPGKARGPRRDILYINEANLVSLETYRQLELRTRQTIYLDFNPADEYHWIYDEILDCNRSDVAFIKSTYKDNPFLLPQEIKKIERYREIDQNYWTVYGEGDRGSSIATIYPNWMQCSEFPAGCDIIYAIDFGYVNPTAILGIGIKEDCIYVDELLYQSQLTNSQRIDMAKLLIPPDHRSKPLYADSAEPQDIDEFHRAGFNCKPSNKEVAKGIDKVKEYKMFITNRSVNVLKEIKSYKWQEDKNGIVQDGEPIKLNDHAMDAMRYAIHTHTTRRKGVYAVA